MPIAIAPASTEPLHDEGGARGRVGEGGTGGGGRQPRNVDIVLDHERHAIKGFARGAGRLHAVRDRQRLGLWANRDEERRIVVLLDACVSLLDSGRQRLARGMRGEKRSDRDGHLVKAPQAALRRLSQRSAFNESKSRANWPDGDC